MGVSQIIVSHKGIIYLKCGHSQATANGQPALIQPDSQCQRLRGREGALSDEDPMNQPCHVFSTYPQLRCARFILLTSAILWPVCALPAHASPEILISMPYADDSVVLMLPLLVMVV